MRGGDYAELLAFAAVVRHGNFARAARHLGMSPSALSQTIRRLEDRLDVRLLNRTTRSVAPSTAGERLLSGLLPALRDLDAAVASVSEAEGIAAGPLRINSSRLAAKHHLAPMLASFLEQHPRIVLELVVEDRLTDIVARGFDAGIRLGEKLERDMVAVPLGGELRLTAVASAAYLARFGRPHHPRDLGQHRCLNTVWPSDGSAYRWEFERGDETVDIAVQGPLQCGETDVLLRAAADGLGIAYVIHHEAAAWIAGGSVVPLLEDWSPPFPGFFLYYPDRRRMVPALRAFINHLR